jgi:hypothetical protein
MLKRLGSCSDSRAIAVGLSSVDISHSLSVARQTTVPCPKGPAGTYEPAGGLVFGSRKEFALFVTNLAFSVS